jgi:hypothetical protein
MGVSFPNFPSDGIMRKAFRTPIQEKKSKMREALTIPFLPSFFRVGVGG